MRTECKSCGCMPKPDQWSYEGSDYCYDCSPLSTVYFPEKETCPTCKGNGYLRKNMIEIHQCKKCKSEGNIYIDYQGDPYA